MTDNDSILKSMWHGVQRFFSDGEPELVKSESFQRSIDYAPRTESGLIMPMSDLTSIINGIREDLANANLYKAAMIVDGNRPITDNDKGMHSASIDPMQVQHLGEYYERPSMLTWNNMRRMVAQTPILEAIVLTRTRQVQRFCKPQEGGRGLGFAIRHIDPDHNLTKSEQESIDLLTKFVMNCGWEFKPRARRKLDRTNFSGFMAKSVRDSLILDSAPIETEMKRDRKLGIDGFYAVDGATIRLTPPEGFRGDPDIFAVQVLNQMVVTAYTLDDLIYEPRNPRTDVDLAGYGMSEIELLVKIVTGFLNAMQLNLRGFSDNSIPRGFINLIGDYSQEDLATFKRYWNAMVSGSNSSWSLPILTSKEAGSKASFERIGVDFDEMYFSKWMTFLTSIACAVYGIAPDEINFESFAASRSALSGNDTAEKLADSKDKGLRPILAYYEGLISDYIISEFNDSFCFRWTGIDDDDEQQRFEMRKMILTVNEARGREGLSPIETDLGDAPLNPSLIGPWMQILQQSQQDEEGEGEEDDGEGSEDAEGEEGNYPDEDTGGDGGEAEAETDEGTGVGDRRAVDGAEDADGTLSKAMPPYVLPYYRLGEY